MFWGARVTGVSIFWVISKSLRFKIVAVFDNSYCWLRYVFDIV